MENTIFDGGQEMSAAYDYRVYDRVWQRVSPGVDPYAEQPSGVESTPPSAPPSAPAQPVPLPIQPPSGGDEALLPGAEKNPCCMGTEAQDSLEVLKGFLEEEMAGRRHCMALACRDLHGAYYLITGSRYASAVAAEHVQLDSLPEALRACYHQEACNGFNYRRAAGETMDLCLQKLFTRLGDQAYRRSEEIMSLLGRILC